jgi:hypothetical protein
MTQSIVMRVPVLVDCPREELWRRIVQVFDHDGLDEVVLKRENFVSSDLPTDVLGKGAKVVVLVRDSSEALPALDVVARLRREDPALMIVVCVTEMRYLRHYLPGAVVAGADDVIVLNATEGAQHLVSLVMARVLAPPPREALGHLSRVCTSPSVVAIASYCIRNSHRPISTANVAAKFGLHRATLHARLRAHGLPGPGALLRFGCILHASALGGVLNQHDVATRVGRPNASSLRALRRRLGRAARAEKSLSMLAFFETLSVSRRQDARG